jgi:hypothetical protein
MRFTGWIFALSLLLAGGLANAEDKENCISQTEMAEIAAHFTQFESLADMEYCFDDSEESRLLQGIMFMRKTAFAADMPKSGDDLFTGTFATDWWQYFIGRIDAFEVQDSCPKGVVAFVYFFGTTMYVCPLALTASFTSLDLSSVFMHEARHIDGYPHITCSRGARAGINGACDQRISDTGSYAVTVETYAQLGRYAPDIHPALAAYARSSAVVYADEAFQTPTSIDRDMHFIVMADDKQFYRLNANGEAELTELGMAPAVGHIIMRGVHMILYPEDKSMTARYVFANNEGEIVTQPGDLGIEYNMSSEEVRANWVDVHIGAQWTAKIQKNEMELKCDPRKDTKTTLSTDGEVAASILYPTGYDRAAMGAQLAMESGAIYDFGCQNGRAYLRVSDMKFDQAFKRIHKVGGDVIGLGMDGKLYRINGQSSEAMTTALDGRIVEIAPHQTFTFFN